MTSLTHGQFITLSEPKANICCENTAQPKYSFSLHFSFSPFLRLCRLPFTFCRYFLNAIIITTTKLHSAHCLLLHSCRVCTSYASSLTHTHALLGLGVSGILLFWPLPQSVNGGLVYIDIMLLSCMEWSKNIFYIFFFLISLFVRLCLYPSIVLIHSLAHARSHRHTRLQLPSS